MQYPRSRRPEPVKVLGAGRVSRLLLVLWSFTYFLVQGLIAISKLLLVLPYLILHGCVSYNNDAFDMFGC